jgi:RHS repeat-associated protein
LNHSNLRGDYHTTQIAGTVQKNFVYGDHNRMTQYKEGTSIKMNYVYNGKGEQVRKYTGSTNTYSLYDEAGRWLADYTNASTPQQQVIWMDDLPVAVLVGSGANQKLHYIEADALGSPRVVVDPTRGATGTAVWTWELQGEVFGATVPNQNPDNDANQFVFNMRFPGQRYDSASGLNQNGYREYEPGTDRYSQSDPIGLDGGISTYAYVAGNPMTRIDPSGLQMALPLPPVAPVPGLPTSPYTYGPGNAQYDQGVLWLGNQLKSVYSGAAASNPWLNSVMGLGQLMSSGEANEAAQGQIDGKACPPNPEDPCKGLAREVAEHRQKLNDYMSDPMRWDHKGVLAAAPPWLQEKLYQGRIIKLVGHLKEFERQLAQCRAQNGGR